MVGWTLSKSDFLHYQQCAKSFWLAKRKPDAVAWPEPNAFDKMLAEGGYAVEAVARRWIDTWPDAAAFDFQAEFLAGDLYARADAVRSRPGNQIDLFEVKASTSLNSAGKDHVADATFQTLVAERAGQTVGAVYVVHVNSNYVHNGDVDPALFLKIEDVTDRVRLRMTSLEVEVGEAIRLLALEEIDERGCDCREKTKSNHCAAFRYFNRDVPERSVYDLPRIRSGRLREFLQRGQLRLVDADTVGLSRPQQLIVEAARTNAPVVNAAGIQNFLAKLKWPLYFFDYETYGSAIPILGGVKPYEQVPVQYSLHRLSRNGELTHTDFLSTRVGRQADLISSLQKAIGPDGSLVSWNKSFEAGCNRRLAERFPEHADFLLDLNHRTVDLMDVFKEDYVDVRFGGSTSLKRVLPVVCPHLQYNPDAVHDGGGAMDAWIRMIQTGHAAERDGLSAELRSYCELDTLAMVEIYRFLSSVSQGV